MNQEPSNLVRFDKWFKSIGINRATAYRWRQRGIINPTRKILGHFVLTRQEITEFEAKVESGQFANEIQPPKQCRTR